MTLPAMISARGALLSLLALPPALAACDGDDGPCANVNCSPCPPSAVVSVTDGATGGAVDGVTVTGGGAAWTCEVATGETACVGQPDEVAPFDVTVTAPGHETEVERVETQLSAGGFCCPDCTTFVPEPVVLQPL